MCMNSTYNIQYNDDFSAKQVALLLTLKVQFAVNTLAL